MLSVRSVPLDNLPLPALGLDAPAPAIPAAPLPYIPAPNASPFGHGPVLPAPVPAADDWFTSPSLSASGTKGAMHHGAPSHHPDAVYDALLHGADVHGDMGAPPNELAAPAVTAELWGAGHVVATWAAHAHEKSSLLSGWHNSFTLLPQLERIRHLGQVEDIALSPHGIAVTLSNGRGYVWAASNSDVTGESGSTTAAAAAGAGAAAAAGAGAGVSRDWVPVPAAKHASAATCLTAVRGEVVAVSTLTSGTLTGCSFESATGVGGVSVTTPIPAPALPRSERASVTVAGTPAGHHGATAVPFVATITATRTLHFSGCEVARPGSEHNWPPMPRFVPSGLSPLVSVDKVACGRQPVAICLATSGRAFTWGTSPNGTVHGACLSRPFQVVLARHAVPSMSTAMTTATAPTSTPFAGTALAPPSSGGAGGAAEPVGAELASMYRALQSALGTQSAHLLHSMGFDMQPAAVLHPEETANASTDAVAAALVEASANVDDVLPPHPATSPLPPTISTFNDIAVDPEGFLCAVVTTSGHVIEFGVSPAISTTGAALNTAAAAAAGEPPVWPLSHQNDVVAPPGTTFTAVAVGRSVTAAITSAHTLCTWTSSFRSRLGMTSHALPQGMDTLQVVAAFDGTSRQAVRVQCAGDSIVALVAHYRRTASSDQAPPVDATPLDALDSTYGVPLDPSVGALFMPALHHPSVANEPHLDAMHVPYNAVPAAAAAAASIDAPLPSRPPKRRRRRNLTVSTTAPPTSIPPPAATPLSMQQPARSSSTPSISVLHGVASAMPFRQPFGAPSAPSASRPAGPRRARSDLTSAAFAPHAHSPLSAFPLHIPASALSSPAVPTSTMSVASATSTSTRTPATSTASAAAAPSTTAAPSASAPAAEQPAQPAQPPAAGRGSRIDAHGRRRSSRRRRRARKAATSTADAQVTRRRFGATARALLEAAFRKSLYPSDVEVRRLALSIGDTVARVRTWLHNRRSKEQRDARRAAASPSSAPEGSPTAAAATPQRADTPSPGRLAQLRHHLTAAQRNVLITAYNRQPYPTPGDVQHLSAQVGVPPPRIRTWFNNRRSRAGVPPAASSSSRANVSSRKRKPKRKRRR